MTVQNIQRLQRAVHAYRAVRRTYPESLTEAVVEVYGHPMPEMLKDGWGRRLGYVLGADTFAIISYGKDGVPDRSVVKNEGWNTDIVWLGESWVKLPEGVTGG